MATISFESRGDFRRTEKYLRRLRDGNIYEKLEGYAQKGVEALRSATPHESGATAAGWYYEITKTRRSCEIVWKNANINRGVNIAVILQYGHGTGTGGYVRGRDYINPAIRPVFDDITEKVWQEVTKS